MNNFEKITIGLDSFFAILGLLLIIMNYFSKREKGRKTALIIGWTLFLGSTILIIQKVF